MNPETAMEPSAPRAPEAAPRAPMLTVRRFQIAGISWGIAMVVALLFAHLVAVEFLQKVAPPAFTQLERFIGKPLGPGDTISPEILDYTVQQIGMAPVVDAETGAVPVVMQAFRTGNLPAGSVRFLEWGTPMPYVHEGKLYWAVPFRYEANMGFGAYRTDTATALVRKGGVSRILFVPFWNFSGGKGAR